MTVTLQEDRCPGCGKFVRRGAACPRCPPLRLLIDPAGQSHFPTPFPGKVPSSSSFPY